MAKGGTVLVQGGSLRAGGAVAGAAALATVLMGRLTATTVVALGVLGGLASGVGGLGSLLAGDIGAELVAAAGVVALGRLRSEPDDETDRPAAEGVAEVRVLGTVRVTLADGTAVDPKAWRGAKNVDVLRLLAVAGEPVDTKTLGAALWPSADRRRAGASLRQACFELRRVLGPGHLVRTGEKLALADVWVDADAVRALSVAGRNAHAAGDHAGCVRAALDAEALHLAPPEETGTGCDLVDEAVERLAAARGALALDAADSAVELGLHDLAAGLAQRHLTADPLSERAARALMRALAARGEVGRALQVYADTARHLGDELGVDPSQPTRALHHELLLERAEGRPETGCGLEGRPGLDTFALLRRVHRLLDDAGLAVLHAAAALDEPFTAAAVEQVLAAGPAAQAAGPAGVAAALRRLTDHEVLVQAPAGLAFADPALRGAALAWLRPKAREALVAHAAATQAASTAAAAGAVLAVVGGPSSSTSPASASRTLLDRARTALAERRIGESWDLAREAEVCGPGERGVEAEATWLRLAPAAVLGGRPDLARAVQDAVARARALGDEDGARRLHHLGLAGGAPGAVGGDHVPAADRWAAVRHLAERGAGREALTLAATVDARRLDPLSRQLHTLATAGALEACGDEGAAARRYERILADRARHRLVAPEAAARLAVLRAPRDPAAALDLLDLLEGWLDSDGERPRERCWRLLARAEVRGALGRPADAARTAASAAVLASASGIEGLARRALQAEQRHLCADEVAVPVA